MQSVSSRIWTRVAVSISYDDNHYTTGTSNYAFIHSAKILFPHLKALYRPLWEVLNAAVLDGKSV